MLPDPIDYWQRQAELQREYILCGYVHRRNTYSTQPETATIAKALDTFRGDDEEMSPDCGEADASRWYLILNLCFVLFFLFFSRAQPIPHGCHLCSLWLIDCRESRRIKTQANELIAKLNLSRETPSPHCHGCIKTGPQEINLATAHPVAKASSVNINSSTINHQAEEVGR